MIDVACALIIGHNGKILAAQRSASMRLPLKWEFPGGKTESGETHEECLVREIAEELGIVVEIIKAMVPCLNDDGKAVIRLVPFVCRIKSGDISLAEHAAFVWLHPEELSALDWAEADIAVYRQYLNSLPFSKISPDLKN
jgi:8-oxo-dGTP diphosphatase